METTIIPEAARPAKWPLTEDESTVLNGCERSLEIFDMYFPKKYGVLTKPKAQMLLLFTDCRISLANMVASLRSTLKMSYNDNTALEQKNAELVRDMDILKEDRDRLVIKLGKMEGKIQMLHNDLHRADAGRQLKSVDAILKEE